MIQQRIADISKKILVSIFLSAAVLSIASIDTIWEHQAHQQRDYEVIRQNVRRDLHTRLRQAMEPIAVAQAQPTAEAEQSSHSTELDRLRALFAQDELGNLNPFAGLSTLDPVTEVMKKGVSQFRRQAYRSPQYKEEVGYDLLEYEIEHPDQSKSTILAYLEKPGGEANSDEPVPVVVVMRAHDGIAKQSLFRGGNLVEQNDLTLAQAQALVNLKLNPGVPFISVAR